jgi:hypothetical protein
VTALTSGESSGEPERVGLGARIWLHRGKASSPMSVSAPTVATSSIVQD